MRMKHELPKLHFDYNDFEPYIDAKTMEIHYTKHHQAYVTNLNTALERYDQIQGMNLHEVSVAELITKLDLVPDDIKTAVRNNGGGHLNHSMFWKLLSKHPTAPSLEFKKIVDKSFGGLDILKEEFTKVAMGRFGSGWAWLVVKEGILETTSTANQDNPLMEGVKPVLGLDLWEHAYYLNYQNRRDDYVSNWWTIVNWKQVEDNFNHELS